MCSKCLKENKMYGVFIHYLYIIQTLLLTDSWHVTRHAHIASEVTHRLFGAVHEHKLRNMCVCVCKCGCLYPKLSLAGWLNCRSLRLSLSLSVCLSLRFVCPSVSLSCLSVCRVSPFLCLCCFYIYGQDLL